MPPVPPRTDEELSIAREFTLPTARAFSLTGDARLTPDALGAVIDGALGLLVRAIENAGYKPGEDAAIALDPASTEFYRDGKYYPHTPESHSLTTGEMVALYDGLCRTYPVVSIEDGLAEARGNPAHPAMDDAAD